MMDDRSWRTFFLSALKVLGAGERSLVETRSWCSWTTFSRLASDAGYWCAGLPRFENIGETHIADNGIWGQPFAYADLAHIVIPREFYWETPPGPDWTCGSREQDLEELSVLLNAKGLAHRQTDIVLEIKLY